jgi:hypothetical protein
LLPVTVSEVLVMVKVLEKPFTTPERLVVKLPDSIKVPGKGPAAVPLTEKLTFAASKFAPVQAPVPVSVDPLTA